MPRAIWNDTVLAESDDTVVVEGNHYFPREALSDEHLEPSETTSWCPWKGTASYYTVRVNGDENADAAWYYPDPKRKAAEIKDRVAFWHGVTVEA
jgi:uncharacterized protein (DUF427 family)